MAIEIRQAVDADVASIVTLDHRNFGVIPEAADFEKAADLLELDRFLVATDGADLVAAGGSFKMELTVPGNSTLPMSGVTWVSVAASHRRQGVLRRLMAGLDELSAGFDEPILGLSASEGPIYERFGYGISTRCRVIELDRRRAQLDPRWEPDSVRLINPADHLDELRAIYDRYRLTQPGELSRSEPLFRDQNLTPGKQDFAAIHPDGYAIWEITPDWNHGHPAHVLGIKDLIAVTSEAHLALWNILLSIDLVGPIRSIRTVAVDDALPYLLTDQRALRTVEVNDYLWLKVTDTARCFQQRTLRTDDRLIIAVVEELPPPGTKAQTPTETVAISRDGCALTDEPADIVAARSALGPLLMGVTASELAAGHRLRVEPAALGRANAPLERADAPLERANALLERADALLGTGRAAHCRTAF